MEDQPKRYVITKDARGNLVSAHGPNVAAFFNSPELDWMRLLRFAASTHFSVCFNRPSRQWHQSGVDGRGPSPSQLTRIRVVGDSALMRRSLKTLLDAQDHWKVCDKTSDGREALSKFRGRQSRCRCSGLSNARDGRTESGATDNTTLSSYPDTHGYYAHIVTSTCGCRAKVGIRGVCAQTDIKCAALFPD
jgi:hypothetical protein